jgi:redox-sensitive bicupin YhaK (pirin superfamily)
MSNINLIIEERSRDIGNFMVGRLLPFRKKRMVGPFIFIDHMGPKSLAKDENLDVPPHPHIGLSTLTYLFEGEIIHKDSLGSEQLIKPGAVNWMTAGKGIVHSERTPDKLRNTETNLHGLQIWVALPLDKENMEPTFTHTEAEELPSWQEDGIHYKLIAGSAFHKVSPVPVHSDLYFIEIKAQEKRTLNIGNELYGESAIYILEGEISTEDQSFGNKQILVAKESSLCEFTIHENTTIYIFGGHPFEEERKIYWNFVASSQETIDKAKEDWKSGKFPKIPNEEGFVPLPG